jgi:hypothetical protein
MPANKEEQPCYVGQIHYLPQVSANDTGVLHLELRISPRMFENIETALIGNSWAWGKSIHENNVKVKISRHCPFKYERHYVNKGAHFGMAFFAALIPQPMHACKR